MLRLVAKSRRNRAGGSSTKTFPSGAASPLRHRILLVRRPMEGCGEVSVDIVQATDLRREISGEEHFSTLPG
jgi:hypothetical protein